VKSTRYGFDTLRLAAVVLIAAGSLGILLRAGLAPGGESEKAVEKKWKSLPVDDGQKVNQFKVNDILRKGAFADDAEKELFSDFFTKYFLPRWTQPEVRKYLSDKKETGKDLRNVLRNNLSTAARAPVAKVHEQLNEIVLQYMDKKLAGDKDIDPAVRVNAMLMIGDLSEKTGQPLPASVPVLLANAKNANQIDAVKVAALVGLIRHAQAGLNDADLQKQVLAQMVELASTPTPNGRRADGVSWMRGQAAEVLGLLASTGNSTSVPKALAKMVVDPSLPQSQRCQAARALGQLDYSGGPIAADPYLKALGQLAVEVLKGQQAAPSARVLKCRLQCISDGLKGTDSKGGIAGQATDAAAKQQAAAMQAALDDMLTLLEERDIEKPANMPKLIQPVAEAQKALEKALK
jgi:hypothetical protein